MISYLVHYDTSLENATDVITKSDSYLITKCVRFFITKYDSYYKIRHLLQNACPVRKFKTCPVRKKMIDI